MFCLTRTIQNMKAIVSCCSDLALALTVCAASHYRLPSPPVVRNILPVQYHCQWWCGLLFISFSQITLQSIFTSSAPFYRDLLQYSRYILIIWYPLVITFYENSSSTHTYVHYAVFIPAVPHQLMPPVNHPDTVGAKLAQTGCCLIPALTG